MNLTDIQSVLEIAMILCVSFRVRQRKICITGKMVAVIFADVAIIYLVNTEKVEIIYVNVIYIVLFLFCLFQFRERIVRTSCYLAITLLICGIWQLIAYYPLFFVLSFVGLSELIGVVINATGFLCAYLFINLGEFFKKEKLIILKDYKGIFALGFFTIGVLFLALGFKKDFYFSDIESIAILLFCAALSVTIWQWNKRLQEIKNREQEIEILKSYNSAYSQLIDTIKIKQHDFHNDLNAMIGIAYSSENRDNILKKQQELCDCIVQNNKHSKLLNTGEPIIAGMLFVKVSQAEKKGCKVEYTVRSNPINTEMDMIDVIELIGILFDNAIEEVQKYDEIDRGIYFELVGRTNGFYFNIRNRIDRVLKIEEISCMFMKGVSEKGDGRGNGLFKVKRIVDKYKLNFSVEQFENAGEKYISFKMMLI